MNHELRKTNSEHSFKLELQKEFLKRCDRNKSYSLRSFAKNLGVSQSYLSKLFNGQRSLTQKMIQKLGEKINLSPVHLNNFLNPMLQLNASYSFIEEDIFRTLSDWYHFAILELTKTKNFQANPKWIAQKLGININEVKLAIERLERLGFIKISELGWELLSPNNKWDSNTKTSSARCNLQKELLLKAVKSLEELPLQERENSSLTLALHHKLLPQLKKRIEEFKNNIDRQFSEGPRPDTVYQLCIACYPLTKRSSE